MQTLHAHAALQLVFGDACSATVVAADGTEFAAPLLAVRPLAKHRFVADGGVTLLWIEAQSPLALRAFGAIDGSEIAELPPSLLALSSHLPCLP